MTGFKWFPSAFAGPDQLRILIRLGRVTEIADGFFLTGGTALAAFYLGHRTSEDLDFFTIETRDLSEIIFLVARIWPEETALIRKGDGFASVLVRGVKIDFVCDPLSQPGARDRARLDEGAYVAVDSIANIASNKLTTLIARTELKDFLDFYFISRAFPDLDRERTFKEARAKERMFEDPASAAYQVEIGASSLRRHLGEARENTGGNRGIVLPGLIKPVDGPEFWRFYEDLAGWLYEKER